MAPGGELIHATCVAAGTRGVLLRGPSGAGKSDLALRLLTGGWPQALIDRAGGPLALVSDDQVLLSREVDRIIAHAPATLAGRLEVRGLGILSWPARPWAHVAGVIDLVAADRIDRLPPPDQSFVIQGIILPLHKLNPFETSAAAKLLLLITMLGAVQPQSG
jgi:HPr kinase/phosphorylase